jgi:probable F420-dependent oxidoreductase
VSDRKVLVEVPGSLSLRDRISFAQQLEERGFDGVTLAEITDPDPFVALALMADRTKRLSLATCVVQLGVRTAPSIAASAATLQNISDGRFRLGLGVSSEAIVSGWHGRPWTRPLGTARESIALIRDVLSGAKSHYEGESVSSRGFQLASPPVTPVPLQLAALNEGMIRLAAQEADGVWLNYVPRGSAKDLCTVIDAAAAQVGRPAPRRLLTVMTEVTDDRKAALAQLRAALAFYMSSPAYRRALSRHGYAQEMEDAGEAFAKRDRTGVMKALTDELIDSITLVGSATEVRDSMEEYFAAGIDEISVGFLTEENLKAGLDAAISRAPTAQSEPEEPNC